MPRSASLIKLLKVLNSSGPDGTRFDGPVQSPSRRHVLRGAAALTVTGTAGLAHARPIEGRVAVVGAGLAGLVAAYRLTKAGLRPVVYEASTRLGGRCLTSRDLPGCVAERGGEFIDSAHRAMRRLVRELDLTLDDLIAAEPAGVKSLYWFGTAYDEAAARRDYAAIYPLIQAQAKGIGSPSYRGAGKLAKALDAISLADWIARFVPGGRASALGQLIENALTEEYAADAEALSGLLPAPVFASNPKDKFDLYYTDSDQRFHVRGGNDQVVTRLARPLDVRTGTVLEAVIRRPDGRVRLTLRRDTAVAEETFDRVVIAIPFSTLRRVDIGAAGWRPLKRRAIATLGMGTSTKTQLAFRAREWNAAGCSGEIRVRSELFQTSWEVSRAQPSSSGVLAFWSGGGQSDRAAQLPTDELARRCLTDAEAVLPGLTEAWTGQVISDAWHGNPWSLGSYAYFPIGYATTLAGIEAEAEGHCFFAGEHTAEQSGYLNAAVETGERAAKEVAGSLA